MKTQFSYKTAPSPQKPYKLSPNSTWGDSFDSPLLSNTIFYILIWFWASLLFNSSFLKILKTWESTGPETCCRFSCVNRTDSTGYFEESLCLIHQTSLESRHHTFIMTGMDIMLLWIILCFHKNKFHIF